MPRSRTLRAQHIAALTRAGLPLGDIELLLRHAAMLDRINEIDCSVDLSDRPREERRIRALEDSRTRRVQEICAQHPAIISSVDFGGDPRGFAVRLHLIPPQGNTWGGVEHGYGI